ncbi:amino acid adenylation domain-containing protein [Streptomyces sp. NBC_01764]|uniref:amino acid adenylation domain-containing protein n=1 Tax=Streptomyces sp. NBC_01764 TaxID=2975935 RepID=UPI0022570B7A|nr:amino acid adenylation domain-containing protein [Streptomyces sp. NBC_01764]MCX4402682.1 amino acid adenylation domain-containing protein [Streptomyces sp. NBC_01764]
MSADISADTSRATSPRPDDGVLPDPAKAYWQRRLDGATATLLPADLPHTEPDAQDWAVSRMAVPPRTLAAAHAYGAGRETTPLAVLLAAWYAVVQRHTGDCDLLLGSPSGTPHDVPDNVLPLRTTVDPARTFDELVETVTVTLRGAHAHQDLLAPWTPAGSRATPRIVFHHRTGPADPRRTDECQLEVTVQEVGGAAGEGADQGAVLLIGYRSRTFEPATADRLGRHYLALLIQALDDPARPVGDLALPDGPVSPPRWALPIPPGYRAPKPAGPAESLVDRFREVAATHGARPALRGPSGEYTYAELDAVTDAVAARLRTAAGPGRRVALLCGQDTGAVAGIWSVLKSGAAYVPLDPRHPRTRLAALLADAEVDAVVCDADLVPTAAATAGDLPVLPLPPAGDTTPKGLAAAGWAPAPAAAGPTADALAYVLHTSGSTGRPKGVMQSHRNALAHALRYAERLRIGPADSLPVVARYTSDAAVMDLFGGLLSGACLHLIDPYAQSAAGLRAALAEARATLLHCTPTLFRHLVSHTAVAGPHTDIRAVVLGGEETTRADVADFTRHFPATTALVNGLGPTECTLALQYLVDPAADRLPSVPVGHPVDGVTVDLVDASGRRTEVFGELVLRSEQIALGYWNRPESTAEVFGTDPDGSRFYRTGDLARRLPDGRLVFCGRRDQQVKIRGHRVEPAEAETLLRAHPTVRRAAVVVDRHPEHGTRLIGYVTSPGALNADPEELLGYLGRQLPSYAVPDQVMVLDRLPIGPTGKLDRARLPAPPEPTQETGNVPRTDLEQALARVWCDILGRQSAGLRDNFLAGGGDSLRVMELLARISEEFGAEVPLVVFLGSPTVETLVKCVENAADG